MSEYDQTGLLPTPGTQVYNSSNGSSHNLSAMEDTASQHFIIGDNLRNKAFYEDAIDEFKKALHIQEPLLGATSPQVAQTHYGLGISYRATKVWNQALYHLTKAAKIFTSVLLNGEGESKSKSENGDKVVKKAGMAPFKKQLINCKLNMARTHHSHGVALQRSGDYNGSILEHRKALAIREHLLGRSNLETARSYYVVGCALSDRGDFDEAVAELRRALRCRILIFGKEHTDTKEVIQNIGVVLMAKGSLNADEITKYKTLVVQALDLETKGDQLVRRGDFADGMVCYRKALSVEEQVLGDLHPTTCDLYLRMADALGQLGDLEASLIEYKSAIMIYERMMGKFHVKVASIYSRLAGILMDKGEYETALSFYAKAYGIYDAVLGNHDDTKQAMMNIRLAAAKERTANESMGLIKQAEEAFQNRLKEKRHDEKELLEQEAAMIGAAGGTKKKKKKKKPDKPKPAPEPVEAEDII